MVCTRSFKKSLETLVMKKYQASPQKKRLKKTGACVSKSSALVKKFQDGKQSKKDLHGFFSETKTFFKNLYILTPEGLTFSLIMCSTCIARQYSLRLCGNT